MRLLFPALGVLVVGFLIGCGGGTVATDGTTAGTTSGTTSGTGPMRAPAGDYTAVVTGTQTTGGTVTGTGTGTSALDGTVSLTYSETDGSGTTARTLSAAVTTTGVASGTIVVGGTTNLPFTAGSLVRNSDGTFTLSVSTVSGSVTETNTFALTAVRPAAGTFGAVVGGTDNKGGTYTGTGTFTLASNGTFDLTYSSHRTASGIGITQSHSLSATLLSDGTLTGTMNVATSVNVTVNGTWVSNSDGTVTLALNYNNTSYFPVPTVAETLTLTRE